MNLSRVRQTLISYNHIILKIDFGNPCCPVFFLLPANELTQRCAEVDYSADSRYQEATSGRRYTSQYNCKGRAIA
jgi:hypothetical protein